MRPLLIWITGIVLQTYGSFRLSSFALLLIPAVLLLAPTVFRGKPEPNYGGRCNWGIAFACLLLFLSIQMTAYHENRPPDPAPGLLQQWAGRARERLLAPLERLQLSETDRLVLATVTLGDNGQMPKDIRQQFADTGVIHILSVSGFHVAIVCGFITRILFFLSANTIGTWIRYLLAMLLLWAFTAVSGMAAASIRSAAMLTLYLTGKQLSRSTDGYSTLTVSAFCMLAYNPLYLYDIGFQLSYTAVASILYLQPSLSGLLEIRNPVLRTPWECATLTLAAQAGVAFLCLFYFERFPVLFLFTNIPLTLIATLLIPSALVWMMMPEAGFPGSDVLQFTVEVLTRSMTWIVDAFSHIPGNTFSLRFGIGTMILSYVALLLFFLYCKK
ncbi:MAG: ComEC/Rec2 family competence protein, partial [Tannerellaceae bacterium]|nr:ComEC/Rec2 family competence protein [Tannerellaceae bacterium]